jgi:hypothetical protein
VDAPEVDLADVSGQRRLDRFLQAMRDPERPREVPARAVREEGELEALEITDAVDDLVDRAIPPDDDEKLRPALDRLARKRSELARRLREKRITGESERGAAVRDLGPATPGGAPGGGRVDEEDRAANGLLSLSRVRSGSSGRRRP